MKTIDQHVILALNHYNAQLESYFKSDVIAYLGAIHPAFLPQFIELIEKIKNHTAKGIQEYPERLVIILTTGGGIVEAVEKMVEIIRYHYKELYFVVPDAAMSAGTIWCMSGDKIYMDYASSLGPIDPQVPSQDGRLIPALGYIDKVNELIEKSKKNDLSNAEYMLLKSMDLGILRRYEQARELSISLLEKWLVEFKFKNWEQHRATKPGTKVTLKQKQDRAKEIAKQLSDNKIWHSHSRMIGIKTLKEKLRLEIEDYSEDTNLRLAIRTYAGLLADYLEKQKLPIFLHNTRMWA